jgi:hypothetical protein
MSDPPKDVGKMIGPRAMRFWPAFLAVGVVGLAGTPWMTEQALRDRSPPPAAAARLQPLAVVNAAGERLGWLSVAYPKTLRENQSGAVTVTYTPDLAAWTSHPAWSETIKLTASIIGAGVALTPEPLSYVFVNDKILTGGDSRTWLMLPAHDGDYNMLVSLAVAPSKFRVVRFEANGVPVARPDAAVLPVRVVTPFLVSKTVLDVIKGAAALISFVFTLPAGVVAVRKFLTPKAPAKPRGRQAKS